MSLNKDYKDCFNYKYAAILKTQNNIYQFNNKKNYQFKKNTKMLTAGTHKLTRFENDSLDHCILVKLTDTSAKYIQEFIRNQDENRKTSIKFSQDNGEIIFSNTNPKKQTKSFQFAISSINGSSTNRSSTNGSSINGSSNDGTTSFECASYKSKILTSVSRIEEKITVKATDEAFHATKEKVISVAEEEKKNSAIEIKPSTLNLRISRNVLHM